MSRQCAPRAAVARAASRLMQPEIDSGAGGGGSFERAHNQSPNRTQLPRSTDTNPARLNLTVPNAQRCSRKSGESSFDRANLLFILFIEKKGLPEAMLEPS